MTIRRNTQNVSLDALKEEPEEYVAPTRENANIDSRNIKVNRRTER
jgi:hypothetical protein